MEYQAISLMQKFGLFHEQWQPKVIAKMNDYRFKVVKLHGDFIWHDHKDTDETFIVIEGDLRIDFRDGAVQSGQRRRMSGSEPLSFPTVPLHPGRTPPE
jgi:mannose-6-phosphate isomerase-like protein (cupin superfamily)